MNDMETKQIINWLRDKADRAYNPSWTRMMHKAAKSLEELEERLFVHRELAAKQQWIPVTERLPDRNGEYLVCTFHDFYKTAKVKKASFKSGSGGFYGNGGHWSNVTHWMPLPEPPKEVER